MTAEKKVSVSVDAFEWRDFERPSENHDEDGAPFKIYSDIQIGGAWLHVEAFLVKYTTDDPDRMTDEPDENAADACIVIGGDADKTGELWGVFAMEGYCQTTAIPGIGKGKQYALFMSPFCK
jgi:hypothetical protein